MIPKKLELGDTIGLISPASPENPENIENGIKFLNQIGFKVKLGKHVYDKYGYLAGKDADRANDFTNMFLDPEVDMVLCVRGGYGAMRILPFIDFNIIKRNPKIFMGFSDITTLLNYIYSYCNLITFHGPMESSNLKDNETLNSFIKTLMKGTKPYELRNPPNKKIKILNKGVAKGQLVGGNLALITSTLGTPYEIDTNGKILFIEEVEEEPYRIDRMLTQLLLSGKLEQCSGFILGQFKDCDLPNYDNSLTLKEVIQDRLLKLNKPTVSNVMSGHDYPRLTLPIGAKVELNCSNKSIHILQAVIK